jgi:hypothetical protein
MSSPTGPVGFARTRYHHDGLGCLEPQAAASSFKASCQCQCYYHHASDDHDDDSDARDSERTKHSTCGVSGRSGPGFSVDSEFKFAQLLYLSRYSRIPSAQYQRAASLRTLVLPASGLQPDPGPFGVRLGVGPGSESARRPAAGRGAAQPGAPAAVARDGSPRLARRPGNLNQVS